MVELRTCNSYKWIAITLLVLSVKNTWNHMMQKHYWNTWIYGCLTFLQFSI
jgi:hypothetical protein